MVKSMELISSDKERQKAFLRTKTNLLKKSRELSVLCDVKLGVLIYRPPQYCLDHPSSKSDTLIWPEEDPHQILRLIDSSRKSAGQLTLINNTQHSDSDEKATTNENTDSVEFGAATFDLEKKIEKTRNRLQVIKERSNYLTKEPYDPPVDLFESKSSNVSSANYVVGQHNRNLQVTTTTCRAMQQARVVSSFAQLMQQY